MSKERGGYDCTRTVTEMPNAKHNMKTCQLIFKFRKTNAPVTFPHLLCIKPMETYTQRQTNTHTHTHSLFPSLQHCQLGLLSLYSLHAHTHVCSHNCKHTHTLRHNYLQHTTRNNYSVHSMCAHTVIHNCKPTDKYTEKHTHLKSDFIPVFVILSVI